MNKSNQKLKQIFMKSIFLLCIILSISLLTACGSTDISENEIEVPKSASELKGENFKDVMTLLEIAGFTNLEVEIIDDLITGWLTKDGEVEKVSINGESDFSANGKYPHDAKIVISYHTFPLEQSDESSGTTETNETDQESITSEDNTVIGEVLDLNAINNTNSIESDAQFIGKIYKINGVVSEVMDADEYSNALIIIHPNVMAKGMASLSTLDINVWLTSEEFEKIGGINSVGKSIEISAELISISRNAMSSDSEVKGYPIELEFGNNK